MSAFPTDAERDALVNHADWHDGEPPGWLTDLRTDDLIEVLRPLIRAREAAAWDAGFDAGRADALDMGPEWPDQPTNPYERADDDRN